MAATARRASPLPQHEPVLGPPPEPHLRPELPAVVRARAVRVLLECDEPDARRQLDDDLRRRPEVDALNHDAGQHDHAVLDQLVQRDLLGPHGQLHAVPAAHEAGTGAEASAPPDSRTAPPSTTPSSKFEIPMKPATNGRSGFS